MMTDIISIDNHGAGFREAVAETKKAADYRNLSHVDSLHLQLATEEMLSMARSITGELKASFWVESEATAFRLCLTTRTLMDKDKRATLIAASTDKKNEAAKTFLGRLRNAFEEAMASDVERSYFELSNDEQADLVGRDFEDPDWDGFEKSVLKRLVDHISIDIRGSLVRMTVAKTF